MLNTGDGRPDVPAGAKGGGGGKGGRPPKLGQPKRRGGSSGGGFTLFGFTLNLSPSLLSGNKATGIHVPRAPGAGGRLARTSRKAR
jgi:hypothetical protein